MPHGPRQPELNPVVLQGVFPNTFLQQVQIILQGKTPECLKPFCRSPAKQKREEEKQCRKANTVLFILSSRQPQPAPVTPIAAGRHRCSAPISQPAAGMGGIFPLDSG